MSQHLDLQQPDRFFFLLQQLTKLVRVTPPELWRGDFVAGGHDINSTAGTDNMAAYGQSGNGYFHNNPNET